MLPKSIITELRLGVPKKMFSIQLETAFDKKPVNSVEINELGVIGGHQVQSFHGGPERALLQYDSNIYNELKSLFPNSSEFFVNGSYGENIVASGMNESNMCIGDIVTVGSVVLEVSQHRPPCFKINLRFNEPTMAVWSQNNASTGFMYRVLQSGIITVGDIIEVLERPNPEWSVANVMNFLYIDTNNLKASKTLGQLDALGREVKTTFQNRLEGNTIEDWSGRLTGSASEFEMRIVKVDNVSSRIKLFYLQRNDLRPLPNFTVGQV